MPGETPKEGAGELKVAAWLLGFARRGRGGIWDGPAPDFAAPILSALKGAAQSQHVTLTGCH